jgi:hypothetical protein
MSASAFGQLLPPPNKSGSVGTIDELLNHLRTGNKTNPSISNKTAATTNPEPGATNVNNNTGGSPVTTTATTFTNSTDGITVNIPKGWGVEGWSNAPNDTLLVAIHSTPPISQDPNLSTDVYIYKDTQPSTNSSVTQYLRDEVDSLRSYTTNTNFKLISANTGVTVAGHPGYQLQASFTSGKTGPTEVLETGFLLGGNAYYMYYTTPPNLYSKLLPQVNEIIQSLKVNPP